MTGPNRSPGNGGRPPRWLTPLSRALLCYVVWLANAALAIVTAAEVRSAIDRLGVALHWGAYVFTVVDEVALIVLALCCLVWIVTTETLYRLALDHSKLRFRRRVAQTTVPLLAALALTGLPALLSRY